MEEWEKVIAVREYYVEKYKDIWDGKEYPSHVRVHVITECNGKRKSRTLNYRTDGSNLLIIGDYIKYSEEKEQIIFKDNNIKS